MTKFVIAVDGGGSKTDAVALGLDGSILGTARGAGSSPHIIGLDGAVGLVDDLVRELPAVGELIGTNVYLSGLDLPAEIAAFERSIARLDWAANSVVDNDLFALLRAGTSDRNAVAVVCGTGINAVGVRADGATARFPALGNISGDWGGGWHLGEQALWHAARSADGRGPHTVLEQLVPPVFDCVTVTEVTEALHFGAIDISELHKLAFTLLDAAAGGDAIATAVVERQVQEIVTMASVALQRLDLLTTAVPVVLGGGLLAAGYPQLNDGVTAGLAERAPLARIEWVTQKPILGAALLALETAGASVDAVETARKALTK